VSPLGVDTTSGLPPLAAKSAIQAAGQSAPLDGSARAAPVDKAQVDKDFGAAMAVIYRRAFLDQYCEENIVSPRVRALMQRVDCIENPELEKEFPHKWPAEVEIVTRAGRSYRLRLEYPKGDPENALSWEEIIEKFNNLASAVISAEQCGVIVDRVRAIEEESNIMCFMNALADASPASSIFPVRKSK